MDNINKFPRGQALRRTSSAPVATPVAASSLKQSRAASSHADLERRQPASADVTGSMAPRQARIAMTPEQLETHRLQPHHLKADIHILLRAVNHQAPPFESQQQADDRIEGLVADVTDAAAADLINQGQMGALHEQLMTALQSNAFKRLLTAPEAQAQVDAIEHAAQEAERQLGELDNDLPTRQQQVTELFQQLDALRNTQMFKLIGTLDIATEARGRITAPAAAPFRERIASVELRNQQVNETLWDEQRSLLNHEIDGLVIDHETPDLDALEARLSDTSLKLETCLGNLALLPQDADQLKEKLKAKTHALCAEALVLQVNRLVDSYAPHGLSPRPGVPLDRWPEVKEIVRNSARLAREQKLNADGVVVFDTSLRRLRAEGDQLAVGDEILQARQDEFHRFGAAVDALVKAKASSLAEARQLHVTGNEISAEFSCLNSAGLLNDSNAVKHLRRVAAATSQSFLLDQLDFPPSPATPARIDQAQQDYINGFALLLQLGSITPEQYAHFDQINKHRGSQLKTLNACRLAINVSYDAAFHADPQASDEQRVELARGLSRNIQRIASMLVADQLSLVDESVLLEQLERQSDRWAGVTEVKKQIAQDLWRAVEAEDANADAYRVLQKRVALLQAARLIEPSVASELTDASILARHESELAELENSQEADALQRLLDWPTQHKDQLDAAVQAGELTKPKAALAAMQAKVRIQQAVINVIDRRFEDLLSGCQSETEGARLPPPPDRWQQAEQLVADMAKLTVVGSSSYDLHASALAGRLQRECQLVHADDSKAARMARADRLKTELLRMTARPANSLAEAEQRQAKRKCLIHDLMLSLCLGLMGGHEGFQQTVYPLFLKSSVELTASSNLLAENFETLVDAFAQQLAQDIAVALAQQSLTDEQAADLQAQLAVRCEKMKRGAESAQQIKQCFDEVFTNQQGDAPAAVRKAGAFKLHEHLAQIAKQADQGVIAPVEKDLLRKQLAAQHASWRTVTAEEEPIAEQMKARLRRASIPRSQATAVGLEIEWLAAAGLIGNEAQGELGKALRRATAKRSLDDASAG